MWYDLKKFQPNAWMVGEEVRRKGFVSLKGPKQEGTGSETGMSGGLLELPANLSYFKYSEAHPQSGAVYLQAE